MHKLNFGKDLTGGGTLNFAKDSGKIMFGVNWGYSTVTRRSVDLDAAVLIAKKTDKKPGMLGRMFGATGSSGLKTVEYCNFRRLNTARMKHSGDDLRGDSSKDDTDNEIISFDPNDLKDDEIAIFGVWSFQGDAFGDLPYAGMRIYKGQENRPTEALASLDAVEKGRSTSLILGYIQKVNGVAEFHALDIAGRITGPDSMEKAMLELDV